MESTLNDEFMVIFIGKVKNMFFCWYIYPHLRQTHTRNLQMGSFPLPCVNSHSEGSRYKLNEI